MKKAIDVIMTFMLIISAFGVALLYVGNKDATIPILISLTLVPIAFACLLVLFKRYTSDNETEIEIRRQNNMTLGTGFETVARRLNDLEADIDTLGRLATERVRPETAGQVLDVNRGLRSLEQSRQAILNELMRLQNRDRYSIRYAVSAGGGGGLNIETLYQVPGPVRHLEGATTYMYPNPLPPPEPPTVTHETSLEL